LAPKSSRMTTRIRTISVGVGLPSMCDYLLAGAA
jgi:hypothetical protein